MSSRLTSKFLLAQYGLDLTNKQAYFVVQYCKDFAGRRAAEAAGYSPDNVGKLLDNPQVQAAIDFIIHQRMEASLQSVDADWVLSELVDNHMIARQQGKIASSNAALGLIAKHRAVDAFAADKVITASSQDIIDRLNRARKRTDDDAPDFY